MLTSLQTYSYILIYHRKMRYTIIIFYIVNIIFTVNLYAQFPNYQEHQMAQFDIAKGISSNNILSITEDQYGFIWVGTAEGLNKFDGKNFTTYSEGDNNISLSNNYSQFLTSSADGNIWVATSHGLNIYNYKEDRIQIIMQENDNNSISSNDIICFAEAKNGMWIATYDKGINFYDYEQKKFTKLVLPEIFNSIYVTYIYLDRSNNLWIGTLSSGLYCYSLANHKLSSFQTPRVQEILEDSYGTVWIVADEVFYFDHHSKTIKTLVFENISTPMQATRIEEDNAGFMWVSFTVGLGHFNLRNYYLEKRAVFTEIRQRGRNFNIPFRAVNSIKADRNNNIWVGTFGDGLFMIHNKKDKFGQLTNNPLDHTSLSYNRVLSMASNGNGLYYFATGGGGIDVLDRNLKKINNYAVNKSNSKGLTSNDIFVVLNDKQGNLWCGGSGLSILKKGSSQFISYKSNEKDIEEGILSNNIRAIVETSDNSIWIGTDIGFTRYKNGQFTNDFYKLTKKRLDVRSIVVEGDNLWIGTYGDGLISYNIPTNKLDYYFKHEDFASNYIYGLQRQGDTLCISTRGAGINLFSLKEKKYFAAYNKQNGLKNEYIQAVEFDRYGRIWVASNQGITCIAKNKIRHFDSKDGILRTDFFGSLKILGEKDSETIFFCGNEGVNYFNPNDLPHYNKSSGVLFNSLKIFNQLVRPSSDDIKNNPLTDNIIMSNKIELNSSQSFFSIGFINIDYEYAEHIQYSYKLKGLDTEWNDIGTQQEVSFRNLPAGKYVLMVKSISFDSDNANDNISELEIIIHPPFWQSQIAYLIYFILLCLLLYAIWRFSTLKMRTQHKLNLEKSERQRDEEINQAKLQFFTNISHELRTPLTLVIGPLETMKQKYPSLKDDLSVIIQNGEKLLTLVNQLLDFRKTEMKEMKLKIKYAHISNQIYQIASSFESLSAERKINLSLINTTLDLYGWYDSDFIDKILFNLLSNAYKFTPEGGNITLEISKIVRNDLNWAQIKIADTGCGIEEKDIDLIFKRFYQAETSASRKGTGIGLHLVKNLVELHHGNISVESTLNKGTTFTIDFPIDKESYTDSEIIAPLTSSTNEDDEDLNTETTDLITINDEDMPGKQSDKKNINILVVDDEIAICEYVKQILPSSYHIIFASNGKEALSIINQQDFDVVISDVMMPEMDGIALCEKIKKNIETSHIPVILLTAKSSIESKLEGLKIGADSYISKPFHPQHLQIRVEKLIESRQLFKKKFGLTYNFEVEHLDNPSFDDLLLEKILKHVNKNFSNPELNGDKIAKDLNISRMTLHRKLKLLVGQTTSELIRGIRLKESAYQIENTTNNISDICYAVGFNSPSYFTACFLEQYGMTPSEYLKVNRKNINK